MRKAGHISGYRLVLIMTVHVWEISQDKGLFGLESITIWAFNLREHIWDPTTQITFGLPNHLLEQEDLIYALTQ
jgi:hypothetical protein